MHISDQFKSSRLVVSVEIFPPRAQAGLQKLLELLAKLEEYHPDFVSVTYGAGGSTRDRTAELVKTIKENYTYEVMPHFTCVGHSKQEITDIIKLYESFNIRNILALRGDPPAGSVDFQIPEDGFAYASDLISYLSAQHQFNIGCAGFPECHIQSASKESDLHFLKQKIDKGVDFVITQFFFCNEKFLEWRDSLGAMGVKIPLIPGIWLPSNEEITLKFSKMNHVTIPPELQQIYTKYENLDDRILAAKEFTQKQVDFLVKNGVPGIHIYSFNQELPVETLKDYFVRSV